MNTEHPTPIAFRKRIFFMHYMRKREFDILPRLNAGEDVNTKTRSR